MTFILSFAMPGYVIQATDRRRTILGADGTKYYQDNLNKMVLYSNRMSFSYTGLAQIGQKATEDWLVDSIVKQEKDDLYVVCERITEQATSVFNSIILPRDWKRQAFVGVGWVRPRDSDRFYPSIMQISNYHHETERRVLPEAEDAFTFNFAIYRPPTWKDGDSHWMAHGVPMDEDDIKWLNRTLRRCGARNTVAATYIRVAVETIRRVAAHEKGVSADVLVSVIPKTAASLETVFLANPVTQTGFMISKSLNPPDEAEALKPENRMFFFYFPSNKNSPVQHGPAMANPGGGALGDLESGFL